MSSFYSSSSDSSSSGVCDEVITRLTERNVFEEVTMIRLRCHLNLIVLLIKVMLF